MVKIFEGSHFCVIRRSVSGLMAMMGSRIVSYILLLYILSFVNCFFGSVRKNGGKEVFCFKNNGSMGVMQISICMWENNLFL